MHCCTSTALRRERVTALRTIVQTSPELGFAFDGVPVANIFLYDRAGKPLNDVLLYLSSGVPLDVARAASDPNRRYLVTQKGERLYNSFPVRYFDPGTTRVAHPNAGPPVQAPALLTPPLDTRNP